jgi:hypothetical protein
MLLDGSVDSGRLIRELNYDCKYLSEKRIYFYAVVVVVAIVPLSVFVRPPFELLFCLIKNTRLEKNSNGRSSKRVELYDYITSPMRFRNIQKKFENRLRPRKYLK